MTNGTEAVVAELAPSQIEALANGAVVEAAGEGVTVAVGGPESDVSAIAPVADTSAKRLTGGSTIPLRRVIRD